MYARSREERPSQKRNRTQGRTARSSVPLDAVKRDPLDKFRFSDSRTLAFRFFGFQISHCRLQLAPGNTTYLSQLSLFVTTAAPVAVSTAALETRCTQYPTLYICVIYIKKTFTRRTWLLATTKHCNHSPPPSRRLKATHFDQSGKVDAQGSGGE